MLCFFREGEGCKVGKINVFMSDTLEKCKSILAIRKQQNFKYKDVQIPPAIAENHGFHIECSRKFIVLSETQTKSIQDKKNYTNSVPLTHSRIPTPAVPVSLTGVSASIFSAAAPLYFFLS